MKTRLGVSVSFVILAIIIRCCPSVFHIPLPPSPYLTSRPATDAWNEVSCSQQCQWRSVLL